MDPAYLLQLNYREHLPDHPGHPNSSSYSPQFWPYPYPDQPTYPPYQCDQQPVAVPPGPLVYENPSQGLPTRLGIFDISAMHVPVGSAEPWGPRSESERALFFPSSQLNPPKTVDFQATISQESSLAQANPYYPLPVPSPPWVHPSPSSDTTPATTSSPASISNHANPVSPPTPIELEPLPINTVSLDARIPTEETESAPQSPPATRNTQAVGRRPGACSRCKKLKVCELFFLPSDNSSFRFRCDVLLAPTHAFA